MKNNSYKKILVVLLVSFLIMLTAIMIYLYMSASNEAFPETEDLLIAILLLGLFVIPFVFLIGNYAKKANARVIRIFFVIARYQLLLIFLIFCVGFVLMCISNNSHIEDRNGSEQTNLAEIKREDILTSDDDFTAFSHGESFSGSRTNVDGELKKYDWQYCSFKSNKISGVKTLQATKTDSQTITLDFSSQLEKGNLEIVIIIDGKYYTNAFINESYSITLTDIAGKTVIVKLAAESASVNVSVSRKLEEQV